MGSFEGSIVVKLVVIPVGVVLLGLVLTNLLRRWRGLAGFLLALVKRGGTPMSLADSPTSPCSQA